KQRITLFVSFVDEMPVILQKTFLDLIKATAQKGMDLKVICSVESSLEEKVNSGKFLPDLYYRLNAIVLNILPLRQRKEDIIPLAESYLQTFAKKSGYKFTSFSEAAKEAMLNHFWLGNADELINSVQRAFIVGQEPVIKAVDLGLESEASVENFSPIETELDDKSLKSAVDLFKKEYVTKILEENGWNQTKTAQILGIQRTYVIRLMNELNIRKK
ncbi:MAG: sigma-54-dependent Fis family transcriptional regulator, partial [Treponema sp.]|nr:sigma-54-dependent Fis family transcriptional regulator [Treponema sp.]